MRFVVSLKHPGPLTLFVICLLGLWLTSINAVAHPKSAVFQDVPIQRVTSNDAAPTASNQPDGVSEIVDIPQHPIFQSPVHEPSSLAFDQEHIRLALRFEPSDGRIFGVAKLRIRPNIDSLNTLRLSAKDLDIYSVQIGVLDSLKKETPFSDSSGAFIDVQLDSLKVRGVPFEVQITYRAAPAAGMYFRDISSRDTSHQVHIWTDGTQAGNAYWIPLLENPADRLTSEIIATVPPALQVLSNGRVVQEMQTEDGMSLYHYVQDQLHPSEDISMFIGRFQQNQQTITLQNGFSLPVIQWTSEDLRESTAYSLQEAPEILSFFSEKLDFTYPWPAYSQLVFSDEYRPDMSLTGFTVFNDRILIDERAAIDQPNSLRLATSVARQWFGHLLSVDHWSDIWLTESLSTYLGLLYIKATYGDATYHSQLSRLADEYFAESEIYQRPLVWNQWIAPELLLDKHMEGKGVWFFHTLMQRVGEDRFWELLQAFTREKAFSATNTDEFLASITPSNDGQLSDFFDDWAYSAGHPEINLDYQYDLVSESLYVSVEQFQDGYLVPNVFPMDIPIEAYTLAGSSRLTLSVSERDQLFALPMSIQPRYVILDPDHDYLASTNVEQSASAWVSQLRYASHPLSQLHAIEQLHAYADDPALFIGLQNALKSRPIPEVRASIIDLISLLPHSDATKKSLLDNYETEDSPLVKRAILESLEQFDDRADLIILAMEAAQSAQSYLLQAQAVETLIRIDAPNAMDILQSALITPSYKDLIRQTALKSIAYSSLTTRERVAMAVEKSRSGNSIEVRKAAMDILASLAALQNKRSMLALTELLDDQEMVIRQTASHILGDIGTDDELEALREQLDKESNPHVMLSLETAIKQLETTSD